MKYLILSAIILTECYKSDFKAHSCQYKLCPYKNMETFEGVINTGANSVNRGLVDPEVYRIDSLHFYTNN